MASTCIGRAGRLRSGVKRQPLDLDAQLRGEREQIRPPPPDRSRICATGRRRRRAAERDANQQRNAVLEFFELSQLIRIVDDEALTP
jgi:hypothetical protein